MLFQSFRFVLAFLPVVVAVHALLASRAGWRAAQAWLLVASLIFYANAKPLNLLILCGSILFNWAAARTMMATPERSRKPVLVLAIVTNVLLLCCFKYANFFVSMLPVAGRVTLPDWSLPLGLSFFTLTQVMFLVDTYQGLGSPNSLFDHATMASLFPYVSSGPMVRSRVIVPQLHKWTLSESRAEAISRGLYLFAIGLTKKVVFADSFAVIADAGYHSTTSLSAVEAWVTSLAYLFQMYFDFSGYSEMAVGVARMLGIEIPHNFNAPYRAKSISEFWQRWHMSLTHFITNYLYTPMLRSFGKATLWTSAVATVLAMGIAGLWHGPAWTFVLFGLLHGVGLSINQIWKKKKLAKVPDWLGWMMTLCLFNVSLVFFRSPSVAAALSMLSRMALRAPLAGFATLGVKLPLTAVLPFRPVVIGTVLAFCFAGSAEIEKRFQPCWINAATTTALLLLSFFYMNSAAAKVFIYFGF
jgi:D-alanyl-lipoteichoic acid acyltransferase DltB (MBOAT superfamily)